jgi:hypothetical protein
VHDGDASVEEVALVIEAVIEERLARDHDETVAWLRGLERYGPTAKQAGVTPEPRVTGPRSAGLASSSEGSPSLLAPAMQPFEKLLILLAMKKAEKLSMVVVDEKVSSALVKCSEGATLPSLISKRDVAWDGRAGFSRAHRPPMLGKWTDTIC